MRISDAWKLTTPEPLQPAIEHIRTNFDDGLWVATRSDRECHEALTDKTRSSPEPVIFQRYFNSLAKSICELVGKTFNLMLRLVRRAASRDLVRYRSRREHTERREQL